MKTSHFTYLIIFAMFLWGGGWSALKILTYDLPIDIIIFWRFFIMSLSFIPILYFMKEPLHVNYLGTKFIASSSVLNIAFMVFSFLGVEAGLAGSGGVIITTLAPIMTFLLIAILFKTKFNSSQYLGLFIGLVGGIVMLELHDISQFLHGSNIYFLLCAIVWAGVTILSQHSQAHINPIHYSFYISVIATIVSFIYAFGSDLTIVFSQSLEFWIALLYLAIFGQTIATTIFFIASGKLGSEKTSSFMFLVPLFSLIIAWVILGEDAQLHVVIGGALSLVAVYFINRRN